MNPVELLKEIFEPHRNEEKAIPMQNYMKNHFPFLGIKKTERSQFVKQFFQESGILKSDFQQDFVWALWNEPEREYQYTALDYIGKYLKKLRPSDLPFMEKLILTKSWWDTVDGIASNAVGTIGAKYPEVISEAINDWAYGDQLWLQRASIIFQLKYKVKTNEELLYRYMIQNTDSKEFFIQKAIGWALREYSKTNPQSVKEFIEKQSLPKLSIREGSKYIKS
ncbi:DNA alkylation repair protein [Bacillus sp. 03113]|uniref:DNA alkylation repair protein n=1 Tax=Bacillus sp. 03113 TaxID=2578211 RepID=UPI0011433FC5|nr:DNA alkylation repair protein [Bacillus sp. 03113]